MGTPHHYILFSLQPSTAATTIDPFTIRQTMNNALIQTFGIVGGSLYIDVLWVAQDGSETVVKVRKPVSTLCGALTSASASAGIRMSKRKDSAFLPAIMPSGEQALLED
ncbi:hypothetical protein BDZ89DRAFT_1024652 [Hymenopellis radicata]|nr:hypothetical protein BDZ89DRAFT_1024652 [Hymenopellis radicata]